MATLVRPQFSFGFEDAVTLEAGMGPGGAGDWQAGLQGAGVVLRPIMLSLQVHGS